MIGRRFRMVETHILMTGALLDELGLPIDNHFTVHRLFQAADRDGMLRDLAPIVTGICSGGHNDFIGGELMDGLPNLKIVSNFGVGYDSIDANAAAARDIIVTNTPGVLSEEVADTAVALMLMSVRELGRAERYLREGRWARDGNYRLTPLTMRNRKVGIAGLGRIGLEIAKRCEGFGLPVSYFGRTEKPGLAYTFYDDLEAMARDVDTLIVVTPGTPETEKMVNARVLAALGANGVLVNIARGSVVDEPALIVALREGTIAAAGLDVMWNEPNVSPDLLTLENCVLLPHVGSASQATRQAMGQLVIDNLKAMAAGKPPLTPVPETPFRNWKGS